MPAPFDELPELLLFLRKRRHETLKNVAAQTGIPFQSIGSYDKGRTSPPIATLAKLLIHYGVSSYSDLQLAEDEMRGVVSDEPGVSVAEREMLADQARTIRGLQLLLAQYDASATRKKGP